MNFNITSDCDVSIFESAAGNCFCVTLRGAGVGPVFPTSHEQLLSVLVRYQSFGFKIPKRVFDEVRHGVAVRRVAEA